MIILQVPKRLEVIRKGQRWFLNWLGELFGMTIMSFTPVVMLINNNINDLVGVNTRILIANETWQKTA